MTYEDTPYAYPDANSAPAAYRCIGTEYEGRIIIDVITDDTEWSSYKGLLDHLGLELYGRQHTVSDVQEKLKNATDEVKMYSRSVVLYVDSQNNLRASTPLVTGTYYSIGQVRIIGTLDFVKTGHQPLVLHPSEKTHVSLNSVPYIENLCNLADISTILKEDTARVVTTTQTDLLRLQTALSTASLQLALASTDRIFFFEVYENGVIKLASSPMRDLFTLEEQEVRSIHDIREIDDDTCEEPSFGMRVFV